MPYPARLRVVGAVAVRGDRVFLARRKPGGPHGGLWEFPGGKVEPGEADADALRREIREELAVDCEVGELIARGDDERVALYCYEVTFRGEPRAIEAQETGWFPAAELRSLPVPPADVPAVRRLLDRLGAGSVPRGCDGVPRSDT